MICEFDGNMKETCMVQQIQYLIPKIPSTLSDSTNAAQRTSPFCREMLVLALWIYRACIAPRRHPSPVLPHGTQSKGGRPAGWWPWRCHRAGTAGAAAWCTWQINAVRGFEHVHQHIYLPRMSQVIGCPVCAPPSRVNNRQHPPVCVPTPNSYLVHVCRYLKRRKRKDTDKI